MPGGAGTGDAEQIRAGRTGLPFLAFRPWQAEQIQGITLRRVLHGGEGALDLGRDGLRARGLSPGWRWFLREWGEGDRRLVGMEQVHGGRVRVVDRDSGASAGPLRILAACDGLVTNAADVLLIATVADCVPLFVRDDAMGAIGLLHAGWRGTAGGILAAGIETMGRAFGTSAEDVVLYMGPAVAGPCYPVGAGVLRRFARWVDPGTEAGRCLDLRAVLARQAVELGVRGSRIFRSDFCTHCRTDLFYSHRAEKGRCGRQAAFLGMRTVNTP